MILKCDILIALLYLIYMTNKKVHEFSSPPFAVILLAAGKGTRMKSDLPKVMHPIAGQPMICHALRAIETLSPAQIVVVLGPEMEQVANLVSPHKTVIQAERLGTGHAVLQARSVLSDFRGDIVVLCADAPLITADTVRELLFARVNADSCSVAVLGFELENPAGYGRLRCQANGTLEESVEDSEATESRQE